MKNTFTLALAVAGADALVIQQQKPLIEATPKLLVHRCGIPGAVCLNQHAARMGLPFYRGAPNGTLASNYGDTDVPEDESWKMVAGAGFVIFDEERGREVLGDSPSVEFRFPTNPYAIHESPTFVPGLNKIFFSDLSQSLPQFVIDLNKDPPTLSEFLADPPIYAPNGGFFHNGKIYYSTAGRNMTVAGGPGQRPGIVTLDPWTNISTTLLDNYYGLAFTDCNDIIVDPVTGFVWFTAPYYSWWLELTDIAPQLKSATYRFDPATGSTVVVNDDMRSPNGIALSPDRRNLYITDTAAAGLKASITLDLPSPGVGALLFNATGKRAIYKFDLVDDGRAIANKRPIYYNAIGTVPDGLKVARNGHIVTATGNGLSVMDKYGDMIVRVQTNFTVNNLVWSGVGDFREVWMTGQGGVACLKWNLQGQEVI